MKTETSNEMALLKRVISSKKKRITPYDKLSRLLADGSLEDITFKPEGKNFRKGLDKKYDNLPVYKFCFKEGETIIQAAKLKNFVKTIWDYKHASYGN